MKLRLKVIWLKGMLGFAINQSTTDSSYPLTIYYFWPKTNAWDQIKSELDCKYWLTEKEKIKILNLVTLVMNCWRQDKDIKSLNLEDVEIVERYN